jgi:FMN phosphatase YigB (HAD superfamily)
MHYFRAIESWMDCRPQQLLLIGDDRDNDVAAARTAGWSAILVDDNVANIASELSRLRFEPLDVSDGFGE